MKPGLERKETEAPIGRSGLYECYYFQFNIKILKFVISPSFYINLKFGELSGIDKKVGTEKFKYHFI